MTFEMSFSDGSKYDKKLIELLCKHNLVATLYLPTTCDLENEDILFAHKKGFKIGCHSHSHPKDFANLKGAKLNVEIGLNKEFLEDIVHEEIKCFLPPNGVYSPNVIRKLKIFGFEVFRTNEIGCIINRKGPMQDCTMCLYKGFLQRAKDLYNVCKITGYFHLIGRSHEIEKDWYWDELEEFFSFVEEDLLKK